MGRFRTWLARLLTQLCELTEKFSFLLGGLATLGFMATGVASIVALVGGPEKHAWWGPFSGALQTPYTAMWQYAVLIVAAWILLHVLLRRLFDTIALLIVPRWYRQAVYELGLEVDRAYLDDRADLVE